MKRIKLIFLFIICLLLVGCDEERKNNFTEISFSIPDEFETYDDESASYRDYHYYEDSISCYINFRAYSKEYYEEGKEQWFKQSIIFNLTDEISQLEEKDISNNKVLYIEKRQDGSVNYYYGFESTNHYYLLDYNINSRGSDEEKKRIHPCVKYKDEIVSSVKLK